MSATFLTKTQAVSLIGMETGYGRRVIEQTLDRLVTEGRIRFILDFDRRTQRISREDVETVIKILKREIE
jgi:membrane-bound lytic murein transglycosylase B